MNLFSNISIASVRVLTVAALSACAAPVEASEMSSVKNELTAVCSTTENKVETLKRELRRIAEENTIRTDNLTEVRERLNPLVAELARNYGTPTATSELPALAATWKQVWSDDFRPSPPGAPSLDLSSIYQVVTDQGYFYNLSNQVTPFGLLGGVLRGKYAVGERGLDIEFTRLAILPTALPSAETLGSLALAIESGAQAVRDIPGGRGPIGVQGKLQNIYLDSDLRIALGGTAEQSFNKLFVLARVVAP